MKSYSLVCKSFGISDIVPIDVSTLHLLPDVWMMKGRDQWVLLPVFPQTYRFQDFLYTAYSHLLSSVFVRPVPLDRLQIFRLYMTVGEGLQARPDSVPEGQSPEWSLCRTWRHSWSIPATRFYDNNVPIDPRMSGSTYLWTLNPDIGPDTDASLDCLSSADVKC